MELDGFVSRNFKPRENIKEQAEDMILEELKDLPIKGSVKAAIVDQGNSFSISVVAITDNKIFSSESHHAKDLLIGAPRYWQIDKLKLVLKDLIHQIKRSLKLK